MMRGGREQRGGLTKDRQSTPAEEAWEVRPGGMLVQKRSPPPGGAPVPTIRVKVKLNGVYHEIYINAQASFGELKKLVSEKTGLHPDDQQVVYRDRERDSKAFLDVAGVKDRSKMVVLEDPSAKARRLLEERRNSKAKAVARVGLDVDKLASKVSALETVASKGGKVADADVVTLTEALMNELLRLDSIAAADGEVKAQRRAQEERVRKYVETLDAIRASKNNETSKARPPHLPPRPPPAPPAAPAAGTHDGDRAGATDVEMRDVRPAVHVRGARDDHGPSDHHHADDTEVRVGALREDAFASLVLLSSSHIFLFIPSSRPALVHSCICRCFFSLIPSTKRQELR